MKYKIVSNVLLAQAAALALLAPGSLSAQTWQLLSGGVNAGASGPSSREGQTTVLDSSTGQMILFGGQQLSGGSTGSVTNDVWSLSISIQNAQWIPVTTTGTPPTARTGQAAVYDSARSNMIIFGGSTTPNNAGGCLNDVAILQNANRMAGTPNWISVSPSGTPPPARLAASAVYDPITDSMIIFGGKDCSTSNNFADVWVLSPVNGATPTWTQLYPTGTGPTARFGHTAVYDLWGNRMIVFGGNAGTTGGAAPLNDAWVLSNANATSGTPTWTQLTPPNTPPARFAHAAGYDASTGRLIIFGGQDANNFFNDTWMLFGANGDLGPANCGWEQLSPAGAIPDARSGSTAVYDYGTNQMIVYGGVNTSSASGLTDAWLLQDAATPRTVNNNVRTGVSPAYTVWRPSSGTWFVLDTTATSTFPTPTFQQQWGLPGDIPVPGDYDGDGRPDYAVWRPSNGNWYIIPSGNPASPITRQWGLPGDIPVPGDYDGDGKTDYAVWRPSEGNWYIIPSGNPGAGIVQQWGLPGDIPVQRDYDGDRKTDYAVWRPSEGNWYIIPSGNPTTGVVRQWGLTYDVPVPGDYDGDGKVDLAVWRPSTASWYIIPSTNPATPTIQQWGLPGDVPLVGDYNGDNKADFTVWRPLSGIWFVLDSSATGSYPTPSSQQQWGWPGDVPTAQP